MCRRLFCDRLFCCLVGALCACLCACSSGTRATICGVPVQGTALQLAASIEAEGDGTFLIDDVHILFGKALICGAHAPQPSPVDQHPTSSPVDYFPDTILCDLAHGQVVHAIFASEIADEE